MNTALMQTIPFVEAPVRGKKQHPKSISIRLSDTTFESGAAMGIAKYWHRSHGELTYAHYVVDETLVYQCVSDDVRIGERGVVCINVCGQPQEKSDNWISAGGMVLENAAKLTAELCWTYGIPAKDTDLIDHRRLFHRGGIMTDVRGAWPTFYFRTLVCDYLNSFKEKGGL